jgi:hypothetical protein
MTASPTQLGERTTMRLIFAGLNFFHSFPQKVLIGIEDLDKISGWEGWFTPAVPFLPLTVPFLPLIGQPGAGASHPSQPES